jgi:hydrogenase nickel incorporation protein HypB
MRVLLLSTTEGDDKPGKYPKAFRTSHVLLISKIDLLPHVPFSVERAADDALRVQPELRVLSLSALRGDGVHAWCEFLASERQRLLGNVDSTVLAAHGATPTLAT